MITVTANTNIRRVIEAMMRLDSRVDATDVRVSVIDGVVRLSGSVPAYSDRNVAAMIATSVAGVTRVDNRLEVTRPRIPPVAGGGRLVAP